MTTNLEKARASLAQAGIPEDDLPKRHDDPLWVSLRDELSMPFGEISALKNHLFPPQQQLQNGKLLFSYCAGCFLSAGTLSHRRILFPGTSSRSSKKRVIEFEQEPMDKRLKFCQEISEGNVRPEENGSTEKIEFNSELLGEDGAGSVLFVRKCYKEIFDIIDAERKAGKVGGAVVTGTPGIGKTMCSTYLIRRFMLLGTTVLLNFRNEGYFLFSTTNKWENDGVSFELSDVLLEEQTTAIEGKTYYVGKLADRKLIPYLKRLKEVVYMVDFNQDKFKESLPAAFTIILTSANKEKYASAVSSANKTVVILWMPVWSLEEIKQHGWQIQDLDERYAIHGGAIRYLLWDKDKATKDLKTIIDSSSDATFLLALDKDCQDANASGRLVHYKLLTDDDYGSNTAVFASKHIRDRVANRFYLCQRLSFQATVDKMKFDGSFGGARGILSELVWHHQLRDGGKFRMKKLTQQAGGVQEVTSVNVRRFLGDVITCEQDMRDLKALKEEEYVSPLGNLPAVDSFMVTNAPFFDYINSGNDVVLVGFQMAGSKKRDHPLKGPRLLQWIEIVKKAHPEITKVVVVFVVNIEDLDGWTMQAFKTCDKKSGKWWNYTKLPNELAKVEQIGLGMPEDERDCA